jgi:hypothetical protein
MTSSQICAGKDKKESPLAGLIAFLEERRQASKPVEDFESFEREARRRFAAAQAEFVAEELARFDIDVPAVLIGGVPHRRVLRCEQTYMTAAGPVTVERTLYSTRQEDDRAVSPMELQAGIVEGYFTPLAARSGAWAVAHLTPQESETMFARMGGMNPSKSTLDRLPKALSERWEAARPRFEAAVRAEEEVPAEAVSVGVSLDGVLVPMKDGERQRKRAQTRSKGKQTKGPAGYHEASAGTLTLYDGGGEPLRTIRLARMPEKNKATLKTQITAELERLLAGAPELRVVPVADGVKDNWAFLSLLPGKHTGDQVVDFWHAAQHLHAAMETAHGEGTPKCEAEFEKYRHLLRHDAQGVDKVIRNLRYLHEKTPRRTKIKKVLRYFRRHRHRMRYASVARRNLPIGSGMVEAACKTLVTQRLKRSGMRWRHDGGQAILTLRALEQSGRFDRAWSLLADTYKSRVDLPDNIVDIRSRVRR